MGETLADIARHERPRAKLVVVHKHDPFPHRSKIVIDRLSFFYGPTRALCEVCLTLPEFQVTGLIGPSGCGKSTLLRVGGVNHATQQRTEVWLPCLSATDAPYGMTTAAPWKRPARRSDRAMLASVKA
jgi:ABC-type glutathione transport system ATPase component